MDPVFLFMLNLQVFIQGGDLFSALQSSSHGSGAAHPLSWWRRGRSVALDISRGLHFLHSQHVVRMLLRLHASLVFSRIATQPVRVPLLVEHFVERCT